MTATAPHHEAPATDERTRVAWTAYRDSLRDLRGSDYDEAERHAWDTLQRELDAIRSNSTPGAPVG